MKIDGVALSAVLVFIAAKAAHRQYTGRPLIKIDDVVTAAQLYAAILAIRTTPVPLVPEVGKGN